MEWFLANHHAQSCFSSLGTLIGDTYVPSDNCLEVLNEIQWKLSSEDKVLRPVRRAINFTQALQKDFIPLLVAVKDAQVISGIIKILGDVLAPIECLIAPEVASHTEVGRITVFELSAFLGRSKAEFIEQRVTRAILDFLKSTAQIEKGATLNDAECNDINNCLLLIRNILHIPESRHGHCTIQNQIVWNLFVQNIDKVLIHLMTCEQRSRWGVAVVQLVVVLYKDQHASGLQKCLNVGFEGSVSESSEDNESNTMQDRLSDSTLPLTSSDPTSDSSDSGSKLIGKHDEGSSGVPYVAQRIVFNGATAENGASTIKMLTFEEPPTEHRNGTACRASVRDGKRAMEVDTPLPIQLSHSILSTKEDVAGTETNENCDAITTAPPAPSVHPSAGLEHYSPGNRKIKTASAGHHRPVVPRVKTPSEGGSLKRDSSQEYSDCGYVSHAPSPEANNSTSSNEEENLPNKRPVHVKPHIQKTRYAAKQQSPQEKKGKRRKKLMKRSRSTLIKMKALANHNPSDEDITDILKEFTVDFMLKGYDPLLTVLYHELISPPDGVLIDSSHFFWLLSYFLKFAGQLELDLDHLREGLSYRVVSYIVFESVRICENVDSSLLSNRSDLRIILGRQHLAVTAIREFILSVEAYFKSAYLNPEDKGLIQALRGEITSSNDLKCLFVLLLRKFKPEVHSKQYLQDLVVTNHVFLSFLENVGGVDDTVPHRLSIANLIKQFASADVIKQYGLLLEDYQSNGRYVNDCILTMMHHIGGEMNQVASLCQPNILKIFSQIWESDFELCDDWSDLIEYVIHRFVSIPRHCPMVGSSPVLPVVNNSPAEDSGWPKDECENLYWYFYMSSSNSDIIANIIKLYEENGVINTRIGVIERLLKQGVINEELYKLLLAAETECKDSIRVDSDDLQAVPLHGSGDDTYSLRALVEMGMGTQLLWIQRVVVETCFAKLLIENHSAIQTHYNLQPFEPIPYYYSLFKEAVPVVPWNADLAQALRKKAFQSFLQNLGFHLPTDPSSSFISIPSFWSPDILLNVAQKLGHLDPSQLKFDMQKVSGFSSDPPMSVCNENVNASTEPHFLIPHAKQYPPLIKCTPLPTLSASWLDVVKQSKKRPTVPKNADEDNVKRTRFDGLILRKEQNVAH